MVQRQVAQAQQVTKGLAAAQQGAQARRQFADAERLDEIVIGTAIQSQDAVVYLVARCEHDDRHVRHRAQAAADRETVELGQHHVEHDHVGAQALGRLQPG